MSSDRVAHNPVMLKEVLAALDPKPGGVYVDATFGAGGYSRAILSIAGTQVYALDCDDLVKRFAEPMVEEFQDRFCFINGDYGSIQSLCKGRGLHECDGVVFDVGLSSMQLEDSARGFSFAREGVLDMRMSRSRTQLTAADFINTLSREKLAEVIRDYGGERHAKKIANAITKRREQDTITSSLELATIIRAVVPHKKKYNIDSATRTFQAIRILVNDEIEQLRIGIKGAAELLGKEGRLAVVSFHSLEHRVVKEVFDGYCGIKRINRHSIEAFSGENCEADAQFDYLVKKTAATEAEVAANPRSRSAYLRAIIRRR